MFILPFGFKLEALIALNPPRDGAERLAYDTALGNIDYNMEWHDRNKNALNLWLIANMPNQTVQFTNGGSTSAWRLMRLNDKLQEAKIQRPVSQKNSITEANDYNIVNILLRGMADE